MWFPWSDVLRGLVAALVSFLTGGLLTWWWQQRRIKLLRQKLEQLRQGRLAHAVLIVSNRQDIRPDVERYLIETLSKQGPELSGQPPKLPPVYHKHREEPFSGNEADWVGFIEEIKSEVKKMRSECAPNQIWLFTNVPVAMGVFLGAILDNGPEVVVHHYFNGVYLPVGSLVQETIKLA